MTSEGKKLYLLFESAAGYLLSVVEEWEEIGQNLEAVIEACDDPTLFGQMVKFVAFSPFETSDLALENMGSIISGNVTDDLKNFLTQNLPKKTKKYLLGVADVSLGKSLSADGFPITIDRNIGELLRGIRTHFNRLVKNITTLTTLNDIQKFQLGLGHSYSRTKLKYDPNKQDKPVVQSISLIDRLNNDINLFSMRCNEWYSWHFPELSKIMNDNITFVLVASIIGNKDTFDENDTNRSILFDIIKDEDKVNEIFLAKSMSMGQELMDSDMDIMMSFMKQVRLLIDQRNHLELYLSSKLNIVAPNLQALLGDLLAARLIAHSGSLVNLSKSPASTIQILGAEKALFRALKTKGNTPKYGLLFRSSYIGRAAQNNKGRISRYLANKCSIASRIDYFSTVNTSIFGEKLKQQVEDRLNFLSQGIAQPKNIDVMKEAINEYETVFSNVLKFNKSNKKEKDKNKDQDKNKNKDQDQDKNKDQDQDKNKDQDQDKNKDQYEDKNKKNKNKKDKDKDKKRHREQDETQSNFTISISNDQDSVNDNVKEKSKDKDKKSKDKDKKRKKE